MAYVTRLRTRTLTAVSPYLAQRWRREMGYTRPIAVIPNSAPVLEAPSLGTGEKEGLRVVEVSDAGRRKNVISLLRAFHELRRLIPDAELCLVGPGLGAEDSLAAGLAGTDMTPAVRFSGPLDRKSLGATLASADVFAHPSYEECCSTAVLEAMQMGVPIIAGKNAGGIPWMLDHGSAGMLVDVDDHSALAHGLHLLLKDRELARRYSETARKRVETTFSRRVVAGAYIGLYEKALAELS
jgi:glycosyltransferase involved in cell wall biosynthesis